MVWRGSLMDEAYERDALAVEEHHWWYRGRRRIVADMVRSLPLPNSPRILDAGCGSGRNLVELARFGHVVGLEPSSHAAELARGRGLGDVVEGGIGEMPFPPGSFDLVTCLDVLEHVEDDSGALRELRRVTAPEGLLILTVPAYPGLWGSHDELNRHCRRYRRTELLSRAATAGWIARRSTHFNALLLPAVAAWRLSERLRPSGVAATSELTQTAQSFNWLLEQPMRAEAALMRTGRRIPAGLSLAGVFQSASAGP